MNKASESFLKDLLNTPSPSGFEQEASHLFRERVEGYADVIDKDVHGNSYAILNPEADFKFMICGHIDEIGLMVTHIDEKGFLYIDQIGGMEPSLLLGQRMKIMSCNGPVLGVIGNKAAHLMESEERKRKIKIENIWVDIGAKDKADAESSVAIGDSMVIDVGFKRIGKQDRFIARGCDDKAGAFIVAEVIRILAETKAKLNISVIGVATVQEEIGLRGAITSSYTVKPHAGIAIDVSWASDNPEADPKRLGAIKLGAGPILHRGPNINPVMERDLFSLAQRLDIPYQVAAEPSGTGTDANALQLARGGSAASLISLPNRYMHTPVEMLSLIDLEHTIRLISEYLSGLPVLKDFRP